MNYTKMSLVELESFTEMFSAFQDLILSMIRNAVRVLPKNKSDFKPSVMAHLQVNGATKHNQEYEQFLDIKDIFISCIYGTERRQIFDKTISRFVINVNKRIKFCIKRSAYNMFNANSQRLFKEDIKKLEDIINQINDNFNVRLPEAKQQGRLMISKIRRIDIPQKARYAEKAQEKGKTRGA